MNAAITSSNYWLSGLNKLRKVTLPLSMNNAANILSMWGIGGAILEELTTCNDWGTAQYSCMWNSHELAVFQQPTLRVSQFAIGYSDTFLSPMTEVEIDWANSSFSGSVNPQLGLRAQLDATELNRIMGLLPSVSGKTILISRCPGYTNCDTTIATAKGWIVS